MSNIDSLSDRIIDNLYIDIEILLRESEAYFKGEAKTIRQQLSIEDRLHFTFNMSNIVIMLTSSLAWVLAYKAYRADQFTLEKLLNDFSIKDLPERVPNNTESLQPYITKAEGVTNLVRRHISNLRI